MTNTHTTYHTKDASNSHSILYTFDQLKEGRTKRKITVLSILRKLTYFLWYLDNCLYVYTIFYSDNFSNTIKVFIKTMSYLSLLKVISVCFSIFQSETYHPPPTLLRSHKTSLVNNQSLSYQKFHTK